MAANRTSPFTRSRSKHSKTEAPPPRRRALRRPPCAPFRCVPARASSSPALPGPKSLETEPGRVSCAARDKFHLPLEAASKGFQRLGGYSLQYEHESISK